MKNFETILYKKEDNVAWITLNRPNVMNAQNPVMISELVEALQDSWNDDDIHIVVITGAGDRAFSAGADLKGLLKQSLADRIKLKGRIWPFDLIRQMPKPVIAAVNGLCLGGGCELAMACDIVIAADNAEFGQPEITVGLIPGAGATQILPRLIGDKKARELIFTGRLISAREALQLGMVNQVIPQDKLREAVEDFVRRLKKSSPLILGLAKMAINNSWETALSIGKIYEKDLLALCFGTEDQKEGIKAFLEKRKAAYKGR